MSAAATPPPPPAPAKVAKPVDTDKLNRVCAIFCKVLDGANYEAAIAKAVKLESDLAKAIG
ncbi:MAG TPA: hypothetical protein PLN21_09275 [Gemmatales bacterium]|nr:hypothetical protein [Gemmatales bacterium]